MLRRHPEHPSRPPHHPGPRPRYGPQHRRRLRPSTNSSSCPSSPAPSSSSPTSSATSPSACVSTCWPSPATPPATSTRAPASSTPPPSTCRPTRPRPRRHPRLRPHPHHRPELLHQQGAAASVPASSFRKNSPHAPAITADYVGFEIPDDSSSATASITTATTGTSRTSRSFTSASFCCIRRPPAYNARHGRRFSTSPSPRLPPPRHAPRSRQVVASCTRHFSPPTFMSKTPAAAKPEAPPSAGTPELVRAMVPEQILHDDELVLLLTKPSSPLHLLHQFPFLAGTLAIGAMASQASGRHLSFLTQSPISTLYRTLMRRPSYLGSAGLDEPLYMLTNRRIVTIKGVINVTCSSPRTSANAKTETYRPLGQRIPGHRHHRLRHRRRCGNRRLHLGHDRPPHRNPRTSRGGHPQIPIPVG